MDDLPEEYGYIFYWTDHTGRNYDRVKDRDIWQEVPTEQASMEIDLFVMLAEEIQKEMMKEFLIDLTAPS